MVDIQKLLDDATAIVNATGASWAVMGGCARNAYAEPRATKDVDFVVEVDAARFADLQSRLAAAGFHQASAVTDPGEPIPDLVLYRDAAGRRVDILFAHTAFEQSALARCKSLAPFGGAVVHVVSAEDLIVYKLIADRPQDRADIVAVVQAQRARSEPLDWTYVEKWCDAWEISGRLATLRVALAED
ncbi:MAG TPA: hypothetical protein VHM19_13250 [Polyangiales bacterium]|jgi:hypothetical protein|nr:hypothetical protein [Polyangiales bacterium]